MALKHKQIFMNRLKFRRDRLSLIRHRGFVSGSRRKIYMMYRYMYLQGCHHVYFELKNQKEVENIILLTCGTDSKLFIEEYRKFVEELHEFMEREQKKHA